VAPRQLPRAAALAAVLAFVPACAGHHGPSLATRRADLANVEKIIVATSQQCRTSVAALSGTVQTALGAQGPVAPLQRAAQASISACSAESDEEIQDLATLTVPGDLADLRLQSVSGEITKWAADAVGAANDLLKLAGNRADPGALADFNAKTTEMESLAQAAKSSLAAAAAALKTTPVPLDLPTLGRPPR
jgi:hypothetical protein